jgi:hypothetical protein
LSDLTNKSEQCTPIKKQRRHSTPIKEKREVVRIMSAVTTEEERKDAMVKLEVTKREVQRYTTIIEKNQSLPKHERSPLTAKRLPGAGRKTALTEEKEDQLEEWIMGQRRSEHHYKVAEKMIRMEAKRRWSIHAAVFYEA